MGLQELLERPAPPSVIVLELYPQLLEQHGFPQGAVGLLESLWARGYTDISHSGCAAAAAIATPFHPCSRALCSARPSTAQQCSGDLSRFLLSMRPAPCWGHARTAVRSLHAA